MKTILSLFVLSLIVLTSCGKKSRQSITSPADYDRYLYVSTANSDISIHRQNISFWQNRLQRNPRDLVSLQKLASLYANSFKLDGELEHLYTSDSLFRLVSKHDPGNAGVFRGLAANCISRHEFWQAKQYAYKAIRTGENKSSSLLVLADVMMELGNVDSARTILNNFTNQSAFSWLIRQVKILDHHGELDSAIATMEKALDVVKTNDELFCWSKSNLADLYGHAGRIEESYRAYLDVLERKPDYAYALKGIAWIAFSHDHKIEEAEKILLNLIGRKPLPEYFLQLSEIYAFGGKSGQAEKHARMFAEKASAPKYAQMYNRYLVEYSVDENPEQALRLAERELQVRPTAESYDLLAWALFRNGEHKRALQIVRDYVEGKSHEPEVLLHLGEIYATSNDFKSRNYLELALESSFEIGPIKSGEIELLLAAL